MFKGLQSLWGSFGQAVERAATKTADALRTVFGLAKVGGAAIDMPVVRQEISHIRRQDETAPLLAVLGPDEDIPESLYVDADIPWKRPYAYTVEFYGRDLATGRYTHTERTLTYSHPLTVGEVLEDADKYFGKGGGYEQLDIFQMSVVGAFTRAGEIR